MVYYFKYFVNTKLTTTTTCKWQIFSCYLIIQPKYLCAKVFTFQYTDIPSRFYTTEKRIFVYISYRSLETREKLDLMLF